MGQLIVPARRYIRLLDRDTTPLHHSIASEEMSKASLLSTSALVERPLSTDFLENSIEEEFEDNYTRDGHVSTLERDG